jgi:hypothetical protein
VFPQPHPSCLSHFFSGYNITLSAQRLSEHWFPPNQGWFSLLPFPGKSPTTLSHTCLSALGPEHHCVLFCAGVFSEHQALHVYCILSVPHQRYIVGANMRLRNMLIH